MAGMAAQQAAPKRQAPCAPKGAKRQEAQGGLKEKLSGMPVAAGVALLCALLALSLPVGNMRALQKATPGDFLGQGDVRSIVEDRIDAAHNVLSVASRLSLGDNEIHAAERAVGDMESAKTAREVSRANQALDMAVSALTTAELTGEDARSMRAAADDFAEQGSFLRQEARAYDERAKKAEALYEKLPMKFLLARPDRYEGL